MASGGDIRARVSTESSSKRVLVDSPPTDRERHKRFSFGDDYSFGDEFGFQAFESNSNEFSKATTVCCLSPANAASDSSIVSARSRSATPVRTTSESDVPAQQTKSCRKRPTYSVLVIDDSVVQRKVTRNLLAGDIGEEFWLVNAVENGERAIEYIESTRKVPDIIIVDQILSTAGGVMLGHEVVAALRKRPQFQEVIIIGCSSFASEASRCMYEAGCDGVWSKPMPSKGIIYEQIGEIRRLKYLQKCMESDNQQPCPTPFLATPAIFSPPMLFSPPPEPANVSMQRMTAKPPSVELKSAKLASSVSAPNSSVEVSTSANQPPPPLPLTRAGAKGAKDINPQVLSDAVTALATGENTGITTVQSDSENSSYAATPDDWYSLQMKPLLPPGDHVSQTFNTRNITDVLMSVSASLANSEAASACGCSEPSSIPITPEDWSDGEEGEHASALRRSVVGFGVAHDRLRSMIRPMVMRGMSSLNGSVNSSRLHSRRESRQPSRQPSRQASCQASRQVSRQPSRRPSVSDSIPLSSQSQSNR